MRGRTITLDMSTGWVGQSERLFQYDYGQRLIITGVELPPAYEVHFSNQERGESKTSIGDATGVDIPDEYLTTGKNIHVWLYLHDTASDGETEYHGIIAVEKRAQPTDQEPTPVQQSAIDQAIAALNAGVSEVEDIAEGIPTAIDTALQEAKDSGEFDGEDGFSPTATVVKEDNVATITITDKDGTTIATVRDGIDGRSGVTDYNALDNKPSIAGVQLSGNKPLSAFGIPSAADLDGKADKRDTVLTSTLSRGRKDNTTIGVGSFAFGYSATAAGNYAHAEGYSTSANGNESHAEGVRTIANGEGAHAEGTGSIATGNNSHAEGSVSMATGDSAHAEGDATGASGYAAHAEGYESIATNSAAHAEGSETEASGEASHAEGYYTEASAQYSHAEGNNTKASAQYSHAEGNKTKASGTAAHAEGSSTTASANYSHAEGNTTHATAANAHSEGASTTASGDCSHAEGYGATSSGNASHAEGESTNAIGNASHAEGRQARATGNYAHAEGYSTIAAAECSHVSGMYNIEDSYSSWPEWTANTAYAVGDKVKRTTTSGQNTTVLGFICRVANNDAMFNGSKWIARERRVNYAEIVGGGTSSNARKNIRALDWDGNEYLKGDLYINCNSDGTGGTKVGSGGGGDVSDVQINGTSILVSGVANILVASVAETQAIINEYGVST